LKKRYRKTALTEAELRRILDNPAFPRSAAYEPRWVVDNMMGPNVLWLAESLSQVFEIRPGRRILDLGCGRALSSIFFAREFGAQVWAADLWIKPTENWRRIEEAGLSDQVFPLHVEAHQLPFAAGFFDAIVSVDAYHYFGTDDCYIGYITRFLKPDARLAIVVPGLVGRLENVAEELRPYVNWEFWSFHGPEWWRRRWERSGLVAVEHADLLPDGWRHWVQSDRASEYDRENPAWVAGLEADAGRTFGFSRVIARVLPVKADGNPSLP
jgi:SAM-dependent methyltransferase